MLCAYILNQRPHSFACVNRHFSTVAKLTRIWSTLSDQEFSCNFSCCYTEKEYDRIAQQLFWISSIIIMTVFPVKTVYLRETGKNKTGNVRIT